MTTEASSKVQARHLSRNAYLYVRQSTLRQVFENTESTTRQYALQQRAIALGWRVEQVVVIDSAGQRRPDWAAAIRRRPLGARPVTDNAGEGVDWAEMVRRLSTQLDAARRPHALAAIAVRPGPP